MSDQEPEVKMINLEELFGEPEQDPEPEPSLREKLDAMLPQDTRVSFKQGPDTTLTGTVVGISTLFVPMLGPIPAYIIAPDDPSQIPAVEDEGETIQYPYTHITIPQMIVEKIEE